MVTQNTPLYNWAIAYQFTQSYIFAFYSHSLFEITTLLEGGGIYFKSGTLMTTGGGADYIFGSWSVDVCLPPLKVCLFPIFVSFSV